MKNDVQFYKMSEEDILDIVNDYISQKTNHKTAQSKSILLGTPNNDLRVIAAVTPCTDGELDNLDLEKIDKELDFNGEYSNLDSSCIIDMTDIDTQSMIKNLLNKLENE